MKATHMITVILELDEFEARWLKALMQNPLESTAFDGEETQTDSTMRKIFFSALDNVGV